MSFRCCFGWLPAPMYHANSTGTLQHGLSRKKSFVFLKKTCEVRWCFSFSVSVFAISCLPPPPSDADSRVSFPFLGFCAFFSHTILATDSFSEIKFRSGFFAIPTRISKKTAVSSVKIFITLFLRVQINPNQQHFSLSHKKWAFVFSPIPSFFFKEPTRRFFFRENTFGRTSMHFLLLL